MLIFLLPFFSFFSPLFQAWQNVLVDSPLSPVQLRNFACRCWGEKPDVSSDVVGALMSGGSIACASDSSEGADSDAVPYGDEPGDDFEMVPDMDTEMTGDSASLATAEAVQEAAELDEPIECGCTEHYESYLDEVWCTVTPVSSVLFCL